MRLTATALVGFLLACFCLYATTCDTSQRHYGCKITNTGCSCYYGCKQELPYLSKGACDSARREQNSNACVRMPCHRGICTQTALAPGFACKCEGTGYYGHYCEKACPTVRTYGQVIPHECIVI